MTRVKVLRKATALPLCNVSDIITIIIIIIIAIIIIIIILFIIFFNILVSKDPEG